MLAPLNEGNWRAVELIGWTRRAYGRQIMYETEGGTLTARIPGDQVPRQVYLEGRITGRMLVQVFSNGRLVYDELVSNTELDTFIDIAPSVNVGLVELELHLIPATFGEARIAQAFKIVQTGHAMAELVGQD